MIKCEPRNGTTNNLSDGEEQRNCVFCKIIIEQVPNPEYAAACNEENHKNSNTRLTDSVVEKRTLPPSCVVGPGHALGPEPLPLQHVIPVHERENVLLEMVVLPSITIGDRCKRVPRCTYLRGLA